MEIKPTNIILGKHVKEYIDASRGEFIKIARQHDPLWGLTNEPLKKYKAIIQWSIVEEGEEDIEFEAANEEHAKIVAKAEAEHAQESEGWDEIDVCGIELA
jgi:hypothetical protein